jgi:hypothetical protein
VPPPLETQELSPKSESEYSGDDSEGAGVASRRQVPRWPNPRERDLLLESEESEDLNTEEEKELDDELGEDEMTAQEEHGWRFTEDEDIEDIAKEVMEGRLNIPENQ